MGTLVMKSPIGKAVWIAFFALFCAACSAGGDGEPATGYKHYVYVVNGSSDNISTFTIDTRSGALTPVTGSPFPAGGAAPKSIAFDPKGKFAYVANYLSNTVSAFTVDAASGALRAMTGSPYFAGTWPRFVAAIRIAQ